MMRKGHCNKYWIVVFLWSIWWGWNSDNVMVRAEKTGGEMKELTEGVLKEMFLGSRSRTEIFVLTVHGSFCQHSSLALSKMKSVRDRFQRENEMEGAGMSFYGMDAGEGGSRTWGREKDRLLEALGVTEEVPQLRLLVYRDAKREYLYKFPQVLALADEDFIYNFIMFYYLRFAFPNSKRSIPVLFFEDLTHLQTFYDKYKLLLFVPTIHLDKDASTLFVLHRCNRPDDPFIKEYYRNAKTLTHHHPHTLFFHIEPDPCPATPTVQVFYCPFQCTQPDFFSQASHSPRFGNHSTSLSSFLGLHSIALTLHINTQTSPPPSLIDTHTTQVHTTLFIDINKNNTLLIQHFKTASFQSRLSQDITDSSHFFVIPAQTNPRAVAFFNITQLPTLLITDARSPNTSLKKFYSSDFTSTDNTTSENPDGSISHFIQLFWSNRLLPRITSQPLSPNDIRPHSVSIVKGHSFQSMVMRNPNPILIYFYGTPYCAHVQATLPVLYNLTEVLEDEVEVMRMNIMENDVFHPELDIRDFPALYFFPRRDKSHPVAFEMCTEITVNLIVDWLRRNDAVGVDVECESRAKDLEFLGGSLP